MKDECLRTRSGAAGAKLSAEKFLWENEARKYVATYERVLGGKTGGGAPQGFFEDRADAGSAE
jgi:hypothetical protein